MPHMTVEYTANLSGFNVPATLLPLNQALVDSGEFNEADIKSRAIRLDDFLVGTQPAQRAFVHVKLHILSGRSAEQKQALSSRLLQALTASFQAQAGLSTQLCVEVLEIDRPSYSKAVC